MRGLIHLIPLTRSPRLWRAALTLHALCALGVVNQPAWAQTQAQVLTEAASTSSGALRHLAPFTQTGSTQLHPAWRLEGLPGSSAVPRTQFAAINLDGEPVLQVSSDKSYGLLSHAWQGAAAAQLAWRWRVDQPLAHADIATKAGDDAALKVCVMFAQPLGDIPLLQRASLALARAATGQDLPSATLCYVWDQHYPAGTRGANPYSARVRYLVLSGPDVPAGQWQTQRRRVADDFQQLFGKESPLTPPVLAVAVGADSDNTQGHSLAYLSQLHWAP